MAGTLYLVATPIGNLGDMTPRGIETLREVDLIAAEDTRNSIKLLNHFEIDTPMTSYHEFNKYEKAEELILKMKTGTNIALITDAGTPAISDPGEVLVKRCHEEGVEVTSLPGACACITALTLSGLSTRRFCFEGFLPAEKDDKKARAQILEQFKTETRTIIFYEAPHRLKKTLKEVYGVVGDRKITIVRELTKKFEEKMVTSLAAAVDYYEENEPRGEYVLVMEGKNKDELKQEEIAKWEEMSLTEHMDYYEKQGMDNKSAMKAVAKDRGVSKREIYDLLLEESGK